jgi:hypothetical protein
MQDASNSTASRAAHLELLYLSMQAVQLCVLRCQVLRQPLYLSLTLHVLLDHAWVVDRNACHLNFQLSNLLLQLLPA